jgi:hypothetical protein
MGLRSRYRSAHNHCELVSVGLTATILTPRHFSGIQAQILASDMMVCANFGAT